MEDVFARMKVDPYARIPIAAQLSEQIAWLIASRILSRNDRLPPIRSLADRLGVNLHTVASVYRQLEGDGLVSTRQGRGTIVLGYDRSRRFSHNPDVPTFTIGVLIPEHSSSFDSFLEAVQASADQQATLLVIGSTHEEPSRVAASLDRLVAKNVDGVIISSLGRPEDPGLSSALLQAFSLPPIVYVNLPQAPGPKVLFDLETGSNKAVDHLLGHGHRRVGLVTGPPGWPRAESVYQGFHRAHADRGLSGPAELIAESTDLSLEAGQAAAETLLDQALAPTAILGASADLALGVVRAIRARGRRIPEDVAVVSCEDSVSASLVDPPLTAVRLPAYEMGRQAMSMLGTLIRGGTVRPSIVILPTQLIIRRSCGCPG